MRTGIPRLFAVEAFTPPPTTTVETNGRPMQVGSPLITSSLFDGDVSLVYYFALWTQRKAVDRCHVSQLHLDEDASPRRGPPRPCR